MSRERWVLSLTQIMRSVDIVERRDVASSDQVRLVCCAQERGKRWFFVYLQNGLKLSTSPSYSGTSAAVYNFSGAFLPAVCSTLSFPSTVTVAMMISFKLEIQVELS